MKKFSTIKGRRKKKDTTLKDCSDCPALCCHDLSVNILKPTTNKDVEDLMWQLNYDTVGVYIRNKRWHQLVKGRCEFLDKNDLCTIYKDRFDICREHKPPHCERYDDWYDVLFTKPHELEEYIKAEKKRWKKGRSMSKNNKKPKK